ncbi:glyoxalase superfamily protein [Bradyrhizobium sp. RDM12]
MRDFRNAKAMAQTLRSTLAAKGIKITIGQSLELIAAIFGLADWNTLAAAINAEKAVPREKASPTPAVGGNSFPPLSAELTTTLHRAIGFAGQRNHEYATLEHLLLALLEDADAWASVSACNADPSGLADRLVDYLDHGLTKIVMEKHAEPKPTAGFQRVVQRAEVRGKALGRSIVTGADTLEAIFYETQSPAARFLGEQGISYQQLFEGGATDRR